MFFKKGKKKPLTMGGLVKGIIIGGAIGSVLGVTLAPKSGKETRDFLKKSSLDVLEKGSQYIPTEKIKKNGSSFLRGMRALLFGKKNSKE